MPRVSGEDEHIGEGEALFISSMLELTCYIEYDTSYNSLGTRPRAPL